MELNFGFKNFEGINLNTIDLIFATSDVIKDSSKFKWIFGELIKSILNCSYPNSKTCCTNLVWKLILRA